MNTSGLCGRIHVGGGRRRRIAVSVVLAVLLPLVGDRVGAAAPNDGEYTSPTYGYSISWDPATWTNAGEYVGSLDSLTLQNPLAVFMLDGTNLVTDLPNCLTETIAGFQLGELVPAQGIAGPTPPAGAEAALMTADVPTDDGTGTVPIVAYFECRWVQEGVSTVTMTLFGAADTFAQVVPQYDALIAGLVLPGAAPAPAAPTTAPGATAPGPTAPGTTAPATTVPGAVAIPPATQQPTGLGTDPALDALAQSCFDGDMAACDDLYGQGASGSPYEQYGDTCAGRQPLNTGLLCVNVFSAAGPTTTTTTTPAPVPIPPATQQPTGLGTDPALDALAQACFDGDMAACDELYLQGPSGSPYEVYGDTCAGRQPPGTNLYCANVFSAAATTTLPPPTLPAPTAPAPSTTAVVNTAPGVQTVPSTVAATAATPSAAAGETYVSPSWGYTVTWDPQTWRGKPRDGGEDGVEFEWRNNSLAGGLVRAVESTAPDLQTCLDDMVESRQSNSPFVQTETLPAPITAPGALGAVYELGTFAVIYFECRPLAVGGAWLQVSLGTPVEDYDRALPAMEDLLAGIQVG